jgi:hypothetical protein
MSSQSSSGEYFCNKDVLASIQQKNIVRSQIIAYFRSMPGTDKLAAYQAGEVFYSPKTPQNHSKALIAS